MPGGKTGQCFTVLLDAHAHAGTAGQDHDHGQGTLQQHGTVADILGICFRGNLLAGGATADQAVESADRTTGNGNKEKRPDRRCPGRRFFGNRRGALDQVDLPGQTGNK